MQKRHDVIFALFVWKVQIQLKMTSELCRKNSLNSCSCMLTFLKIGHALCFTRASTRLKAWLHVASSLFLYLAICFSPCFHVVHLSPLLHRIVQVGVTRSMFNNNKNTVRLRIYSVSCCSAPPMSSAGLVALSNGSAAFFSYLFVIWASAEKSENPSWRLVPCTVVRVRYFRRCSIVPIPLVVFVSSFWVDWLN